MSLLCDNGKMAESCASCSEEFVKNAGRYIFDDNVYCPACWREGDVLMSLRVGGESSSVADKNDE